MILKLQTVGMSPFVMVVGLVVSAAIVLFLRRLYMKLQEAFFSNFVCGLHGLVHKMKEYELDGRAGLIICSGANLEIRYVDESLQQLIGRPSRIEDILMPSIQEKHRRIVRRYVASQQPLPDSLNHPLRNVFVQTKNGELIRSKLIIGKFDLTPCLHQFFYVIMQPCENAVPFSKRASFAAQGELDAMIQSEKGSNSEDPASSDDVASEKPSSESLGGDSADAMIEIYGLGASSYIGRGLVPATERYSQATVLSVDIANFTRHCMVKGLDEINAWMARIHASIDRLVDTHAIRKVETRGDGFICVSGTNFASAEDATSRDLSSTQATRMLSFAHDLGLALSAIEGTEIRMGLATGSVVLMHIAHGGDVLPAKYIYGDTVNMACRMEQTGRAGAVQLTESSARTYAEESGEAVPPLQHRLIKGKGLVHTALYSYADSRFFSLPDSEQ